MILDAQMLQQNPPESSRDGLRVSVCHLRNTRTMEGPEDAGKKIQAIPELTRHPTESERPTAAESFLVPWNHGGQLVILY